MGSPQFSDPGGEKVNAPVGSEDWAKRWRLEVQANIAQLPGVPENVISYFKSGAQARVWTLLNRRDGSRFRTFSEFLEEPYPWGLGDARTPAWPHGRIRPFLDSVLKHSELQMLTVAPDGRRDNRRGGKGLDDSRPRDENQTRASDTRLRAILRAPAEVQQWYRDDVISQKVAAKLGPRRQTPERAAHIREVVNAVATFVHPKAHDPSSRKQVDAYVRRMLGVKTVDPVDRVLGMVSKFNAEQRRRFLQGLESLGMARRSSGS